MSRHKRPKIILNAAPASTSSPPPAPAKPAEEAKRSGWLLSGLLDLVVSIVIIVGFVAIAVLIDGIVNPPLPIGWDCWTRERTTANGPEKYRYCEASPGWHTEISPTAGGRIVVPDDARPVRRHYVSD